MSQEFINDRKVKLERKKLQLKREFEMREAARRFEEYQYEIEEEMEEYVMERPMNICSNCNKEFTGGNKSRRCKECRERYRFTWYKKPEYDKKRGVWYKPEIKEYIRIRTRLPAFWTKHDYLVFCEENMRYLCDPSTFEIRSWLADGELIDCELDRERQSIERDVVAGMQEYARLINRKKKADEI